MANLLWSQEFNTPLDLKSASNPNGLWAPVDFWQNINSGGYEDFAGTSFNINPNNPTFAPYNPFSVENGYLQIEASRTPSALVGPIQQAMSQQGQPGGVPDWTGGILITNKDVQTFTYGYFEFRERVVGEGKGEFPAMWFYSANESGDAQGKSSAEIDLSEIFGTPGKWSTTLHGAGTTNVGTHTADTTGWHTYGMNWQKDLLQFYEDGQVIYTVTGAAASYFNDLKMSIRVNFSMDAPWFPASSHSDSTTPSHMDMQIDYIRQYDTFPGSSPPPPPDNPPPPPPPPPGTNDTLTLAADKWASGKPIDLGSGNDTLNIVVTDAGHDIHTLGAPSVTNVENTNLWGQPGSDWVTLRGAQLDAFLQGNSHIDLGGGYNIIDLDTTSLRLNQLGASDPLIQHVQQYEVLNNNGVTIDMHGQTEAFKFYGNGGNDTFIGGSGHDTFTGRGGNDVFGVSDGDVVKDFVHGQDHIKVANPAAVTWNESGGNTVVHLDATHTMLLTGINLHLAQTDFIA